MDNNTQSENKNINNSNELELKNIKIENADVDIKIDATPEENKLLQQVQEQSQQVKEPSDDSSNDFHDISDETVDTPDDNVENTTDVPDSNVTNETNDTGETLDMNDDDGEDFSDNNSNKSDLNNEEKKDNSVDKESNSEEKNNYEAPEENKNNSEKNPKEESAESKNTNDTGEKNNLNDKQHEDNKPDNKEENTPEEKNKENNNQGNETNDKKSSSEDNKEPVASEKKETPDALQNKRDSVKNQNVNRQNNSNKPKSGSSIKDRAKNRAKNNIKSAAKDRFNQSNLGQGIQSAKDKIDKAKQTVDKVKKVAKGTKKAVSLAPKIASAIAASWPVWLTILIVTILAAIVVYLTPGVNGNTNSDAISNYSEVDQKTIEKLRKLFEKYPSSDGTLAMITVSYPYNDFLWSSNTIKLTSKYHDTLTDDATIEDPEEGDDKDEVIKDDADKIMDDQYLSLYRKYSYRNKLKKLLKELQNGEESFFNYLKDSYFKNDKGYKAMFANAEDAASLENAIIEDLKSRKSDFANYVYGNAICTSTMVDAGQVNTPDLLSSEVLVDLKLPGCSGDIDTTCSASYYDTYLTMKDYIKGVVYEEISGTTDVNVIAAQMVAAKTFTLHRRVKSIKKDSVTDAYVIPMKWSTADQDFCNVDLGCNADDIKEHYGYGSDDKRLFHGANRGPASDAQKTLYEQAWELSKDVYVVNSDGSAAGVGYYAGCSAGVCMDQTKLINYSNVDFKSILSTFYTSFSLATVAAKEDGTYSSTIQTAGATVCTNSTTNMTATRAKIVALALQQVGKIPYYEGGLATVAGYDGNDFNTDITADANGKTKKGLGGVGFINWTYWSVIEDNFGNINSIDNIINNSFEVTKDKLLMGDIGYSEDKTVIGIYADNNNWIYEDKLSGNVVSQPTDIFTKFIRLNKFKDEAYNFKIRTETPTPSEWNTSKEWFKYSADNTGQCPWYARNRAGEIIAELYSNASLTKTQYNTLLSRVLNTSGDGNQFYPSGQAAKAGYPGSTNFDEIKAGSYMALNSTSSPEHGHVVIIEYANQAEDKIVVTDGWCTGCNTKCANSFDCVNWQKQEFTYASFKEKYLAGSKYSFRGYLYFLQEL